MEANELKRAVTLAIELADKGDVRSVAQGAYANLGAGESLRELDRLSGFVASLAGVLNVYDAELSCEISAFLSRVREGR